MSEKFRCSVCEEKKAEGVYSSRIAPVSLAYCQSCMQKGADCYDVVVTKTSLLQYSEVRSERLQHIIHATLNIKGITVEQFEADVKKALQKRQEKLMLDKIKGGLFGVAIGDAMGGTTEFMTEQEIKDKYGTVEDIIGGGVWDLTPGEVTDDTQMTIAVAKGIISNPQDPIESIGEYFLKWYASNPKDVGMTVSAVLRQYKEDWFHTAKQVHYQFNEMSAGNGTLMRCLPIALAYSSIMDIFKHTTLQSKMTHYDEEASDACLIYNKIAFKLLNNEPLKLSIENEVQNTIYEAVLTNKPSVPPDGYVVHTLLWVIYYLYHVEDFNEIAIQATNKGGDSDTIAAIACGLKGIEVGYKRLPHHLTNKILIRDEISNLAIELFKVRMIGTHL